MRIRRNKIGEGRNLTGEIRNTSLESQGQGKHIWQRKKMFLPKNLS